MKNLNAVSDIVFTKSSCILVHKWSFSFSLAQHKMNILSIAAIFFFLFAAYSVPEAPVFIAFVYFAHIRHKNYVRFCVLQINVNWFIILIEISYFYMVLDNQRKGQYPWQFSPKTSKTCVF